MEETRQPATADVSARDTQLPLPDKPDRVFEYTGTRSKAIIGAVSGKAYYFRFPGEKVVIDFIDAFAMMAETDLRVVN